MFEIEVTNNRATTKRGELLTKGQVGAQVQFTFNDHWTNMKKTAVFKRCGKTIDVMDRKWNGDIVTVPPEMTEAAGLLVHVGVYGVSEDGKRITPTLYAPLGAVALGAEPDGDPSTDPTLPVWAQIQAQIGDLSNLTTEDKTNLVAAINEAAKSGGEAYTATVAADSGKTITSVVVKMGGADITATAYMASSGAINIAKVTGAVTITAAASAPSVTYNITRNLTNCASSNTANTIAEGASYTTTLSPIGTYKKLGAITVTMGGTDISASAVSGSTVSIANVTGNITITCAAEITNIIDTIGISANTRLSTSSGDNRTQSGYAAIGANKDSASLIHLMNGETLRIKGASLPAANDSYSAIALHNADGTFNVPAYLHNGLTWNGLTFNNVGDSVVVTAVTERYFRVSLICANADAVIATINEPIT